MGLGVLERDRSKKAGVGTGDGERGISLEMKPSTLLQVEDLRTYFTYEEGLVRAVDGVSFEVGRQKVLGLVGESGCGKSVTALSIMQLIPAHNGRIHSGKILYNRKGGIIDIARLSPKDPAMRSIRGNEIAMIFQEPMTSLNPVYSGVSDRRGDPASPKRHQEAGLGYGHRHAGQGGDPKPGSEGQGTTPVERRNAPACDDRDGAVNRSLLIADEPTTALRRDHPGPDPRSHGQARKSSSKWLSS